MTQSEDKNTLRFAVQDISALKGIACQQIFDSPIDFSACDERLRTYLHHYGFDELHKTNAVNYAMGVLHFDGMKLVGHWWRKEKAKGTVLLVHGLFDHVGIYLKIVDELLSKNYNVFSVDMPGHGLSEGPEASINDFSDYSRVLDVCMALLINSGEKHILPMGQSTGGAGVLKYLNEGENRNVISKAVLLAPLIRPRSWWSVNLGYLLLHKFIKNVPRKFAVNSTDKVFLDFLANKDPLQPKNISVEWLRAMRKWVKEFPSVNKNTTPLLIIQGDDDLTVDWEYNLPLIQQRFSNTRVLMLPGAKHHLVNEAEFYREKINEEIARFLG